MKKQREFALETILAVTTGQPVATDYDDIIEMAQFIFMDPLINTMSLQIIKNSMLNHIYDIHPELKSIKFEEVIDGDLDKWVATLKTQLGDTLPISIINFPLITQKKENQKVKAVLA